MTLLSDYIDGELSPEDAAALDRHMADCPSCDRFLRSLKTTVDWSRDTDLTEAPAEVVDRLYRFLKSKLPDSEK